MSINLMVRIYLGLSVLVMLSDFLCTCEAGHDEFMWQDFANDVKDNGIKIWHVLIFISLPLYILAGYFIKWIVCTGAAAGKSLGAVLNKKVYDAKIKN